MPEKLAALSMSGRAGEWLKRSVRFIEAYLQQICKASSCVSQRITGDIDQFTFFAEVLPSWRLLTYLARLMGLPMGGCPVSPPVCLPPASEFLSFLCHALMRMPAVCHLASLHGRLVMSAATDRYQSFQLRFSSIMPPPTGCVSSRSVEGSVAVSYLRNRH